MSICEVNGINNNGWRYADFFCFFITFFLLSLYQTHTHTQFAGCVEHAYCTCSVRLDSLQAASRWPWVVICNDRRRYLGSLATRDPCTKGLRYMHHFSSARNLARRARRKAWLDQSASHIKSRLSPGDIAVIANKRSTLFIL